MKRVLVLLALMCASIQPIAKAAGTEPASLPESVFVENRGQVAAEVGLYSVQGPMDVFFTDSGITYEIGHSPLTWAIKMDFLDANLVRPQGRGRALTDYNFLRGPREQWRPGVPSFAEVFYPNLWDGIDLRYYKQGDRFEFDFIVAPGADPSRIRLSYRGAQVSRTVRGTLELKTPVGTVIDRAPVTYQGATVIPSSFNVLDTANGFEFGFVVGAYDRSKPLVIDPITGVDYAGHVGGSGDDTAWSFESDAAGNAYLAGSTKSPVFPAEAGPQNRKGGKDAFVAKVDFYGKLSWFTLLGGEEVPSSGFGIGGWDDEGANDLAIDREGNVYVAGTTTSPDFPRTQGRAATERDAFVVKLRASDSSLLYSHVFGGRVEDGAIGVDVDASGRAVVTGESGEQWNTPTANRFPRVGPLGTRIWGGGNKGVWLAAFTSTGAISNAGFIGGNGDQNARRVAVTDDGSRVYVIGGIRHEFYRPEQGTYPFPVIPPDGQLTASFNAFVTAVRMSDATLPYSRVIRNAGRTHADDIDIDPAGNAYVVGDLNLDAGFPKVGGPDLTYAGPSETSFGGCCHASEGFIMKLNASGGIVYSGFIGGDKPDRATAVKVRPSDGVAFVGGITRSTEFENFPLEGGPWSRFEGSEEGFLAMVSPSGDSLWRSGYISGSGAEQVTGVGFDAQARPLVGGWISGGKLHSVVGPSTQPLGGLYDAFVTRIAHDSDDDGLSDDAELTIGTDRERMDTDGDRVYDGREVWDGTNPRDALPLPGGSAPSPTDVGLPRYFDDSMEDSDGDGISDADEERAGSDPNDPYSFPTPVANTPSEQEVRNSAPDRMPFGESRDSDGDGFSDERELAAGSDPYNPSSFPTAAGPVTIVPEANQEIPFSSSGRDSDGDGQTDVKESGGGSNPNDPTSFSTPAGPVKIVPDETPSAPGATVGTNGPTAIPVTGAADGDSDGDGYTDAEEREARSDPYNPFSIPAPVQVRVAGGPSVTAVTLLEKNYQVGGTSVRNPLGESKLPQLGR